MRGNQFVPTTVRPSRWRCATPFPKLLMNSTGVPKPTVPSISTCESQSGNVSILVVMGVSGSGKTTVAEEFARVNGWIFADADSFHPQENIGKMTAGIPLSDADRLPWLANIRHFLAESAQEGHRVVLACSALKEFYRAAMVPDRKLVRWVFLNGDFAVILERLCKRQGHFMNPSLLRSQFELLEIPVDAIQCDVRRPVLELVAQIQKELDSSERAPGEALPEPQNLRS